jgi:hypothetical protein
MGIPLPEPVHSEVQISIMLPAQPSAAATGIRLSGLARMARSAGTDSQYFDLMLWRAAEMEMSTREKIAREDAKARNGLYIGKSNAHALG